MNVRNARGWALMALCACALATSAHASAPRTAFPPSPLALQLVQPADDAGGLLAQRVIDREWGPSDDSTYRTVEVPGWKSEGLAFALSGAAPGAGQLYDGSNGGWLFALVEVAGWTGRWYVHHRAVQDLDDLAKLAGNPADSTAGFSFTRYQRATGGSTAALAQLWALDRNAYYRALLNDPDYLPGFAGSRPADTAQAFDDMLSLHDTNLRRASMLGTLLWFNHLVAAVDALRSARVHNAPLVEDYHLELGERMQRGELGWRAALVRSF